MNAESIFDNLPSDGFWSGPVEVVLDNPSGKLIGSGTIKFASASRPSVEITIDEFEAPPEYEGNLIAFLDSTLPIKTNNKLVVPIMANEDQRAVSSFELRTKQGVFAASQGMLLTPIMFGLATNEAVSVVLNDLTYSVSQPEPARYWMIPLQGPLGNHYFKRGAIQHPIGLGEYGINSFSSDGKDCWLQIFESGKQLVHPLAAYDGIVFGELQSTPKSLEETWNAIPTGLMESLSFAVGADVVAPWIELRTAGGQLVSRLMFALGHRTFSDGFAAFSKVNEFPVNSGIGAFLKAFFSLPRANRQSMIPVLNLLRSGAPGSFTIEQSLTDLVKALDNLCSRHGFVSQDLLKRLDQINQDKVRDLVGQTRIGLLQIAQENKSANRQDQGLVLDDIAARLAGVASTSRNVGLAVNDLLEKFQLFDGAALEKHYAVATSNKKTWTALLSAVRGEVIHKGFLRIDDRKDLITWFHFARHLHDLCKRVVFKEISYAGQYQASTNPWQNNYSIDRITPNASLKEFGFSRLPTHL